MWINFNHLKDAGDAANTDMSYLKHFVVSFKEFLFCLAIAVGSLVHAIFPWVINFKLIEFRVARIKELKKKFPNDPCLKKIQFDE
jgi:hypothetical protein